LLVQEKVIETLSELGLSVLQAKVYLALCKLDEPTGRATAKAANVASQDVYRILAELQEKSLVEKIIDKPNKYRAIPLKEGIKVLLQRRDNQTIELKNTIAEILRNFESSTININENPSSQFMLIPAKEPAANNLGRLCKSAKVSVDLMSDCRSAMESLEAVFDYIMKDIKRGMKFRHICDKPNKKSSISKSARAAFSALTKTPAFEARYTSHPLPVKLLIKDKREVMISTQEASSNENTPYLWSNNPIIVEVIQKWYDTIWTGSAEEKAQSTKL
jgi:sugar-specific transcriptional regulator TrmB